MSLNGNLILIGVISAAYGIKGEFIVKSFSRDPASIDKLKLLDKNGSPIKINFVRVNNKGGVICSSPDIATRNAAESLTRTQLYCKREELPILEEDEFYHNDLIGMEVRSLESESIDIDKDETKAKSAENQEAQRVGVIKAVFDFGAGDVIEISFDDGKDLMFPFNKNHFPEIHKNYVLFKSE